MARALYWSTKSFCCWDWVVSILNCYIADGFKKLIYKSVQYIFWQELFFGLLKRALLLTGLPWYCCPEDRLHLWSAWEGLQTLCCTCESSYFSCLDNNGVFAQLFVLTKTNIASVMLQHHMCLLVVSNILTETIVCPVFGQSLKYKDSLWGVERPLHEQDPGHHHGEHVLHPWRHLVGGRRSEVDVQHPHLKWRWKSENLIVLMMWRSH